MGEYADLAIEQEEEAAARRLHYTLHTLALVKEIRLPAYRTRIAMGGVHQEQFDPLRHWRMRDGRFLRPAEMETGHLVNALRMTLRRSSIRRRIKALHMHPEFRRLITANPYAPECIELVCVWYPLIRKIVSILDRRSNKWRTWL